MRVLHLTSEYPPVIWGGLGTGVGGLTVASARAGIAVDVLLVGHAGSTGYGQLVATQHVTSSQVQSVDEPGTVTIFQVPRASAIDTALRLVCERQPDVIHIHPVELWPIARAIQQHTGTPLVYTVHSLNLAEYQVGQEPPEILTLWHIQEELIAAANRVITLTRSEKELLIDTCPGTRNRVRIVGNGIEDCAKARDATCRNKRNESPLVLYTGRFVDRKGIHELLAAIPLVLAQAPATRFMLVGGYGSGSDIEQRWLPPWLWPYRHQIHFTGWLKPFEVAEWYSAADILVVPSWYEPFGMVILEGMLYGLPIAASDVGGPAEILEHRRTGLLFPPRDAAALADAVLQLVQDADLRQHIGGAAADHVRRHWLWPHIVEQMRLVYQEAIWTRLSRAKIDMKHISQAGGLL